MKGAVITTAGAVSRGTIISAACAAEAADSDNRNCD